MPDSSSRLPARPSLEQLRKQAKDMLRLYRSGDPSAAARACAAIPRLAGADRLDDLGLADMQFVLAHEYGFEHWAALMQHAVREQLGDPTSAAYGISRTPPFYRIDWTTNTIELRPTTAPASAKAVRAFAQDWDTIVAVMKALRITGLDANGLMTDDALARVSRLEHVTRLNLGGSDAMDSHT